MNRLQPPARQPTRAQALPRRRPPAADRLCRGVLALLWLGAAWAAVALSLPAQAALAVPAGPLAPPVAPAPSATGASPAPVATLDLQSAVVEAVDLPRRLLTLRGQQVPVDAALRVVVQGRLGHELSLLRAGQRVRVALQGTGRPDERRVVLVYVDAQP